MHAVKVVAFDVDGTLTKGISWRRIHKVIGISPEDDKRWHDDYYVRHSITFKHWIDDLLSTEYKKSQKTRQEIYESIKTINFQPRVQSVITLLGKKFHLCLVSSGVDVFVQEVARRLRIQDYQANYTFRHNASDVVTGISYEAPEEKAKVLFLKKICKERGLQPSQIVFVGDSFNDLDVFKFTQHGILVGNGNEELKRASWEHVANIAEIPNILFNS